MSYQDYPCDHPNDTDDRSQHAGDEQEYRREIHASHNDGGDYDVQRLRTHDYDGHPLKAEPLPIAQVASELVQRASRLQAITPPAETKMSRNQLEARIEQMEATEARNPMSYKPAAEARRAKIARHKIELAARPADEPKPDTTTRAAPAETDQLGEAIRALVAAFGRPAVIDATWATAKAQPEAWR